MGTPGLTDTVHAERWDYRDSRQPRHERQQERISVIFSDDQLVSL
ncbi:hypothetical protein B1218_33235, partial [Pseudomonas ogarae]